MGINVLSVRHDEHGLAEVERVSVATEKLQDRLAASDGIDGVVVLRTCNRVEVMWDGNAALEDVQAESSRGLTPRPSWDVFSDAFAVHHIFRVASGLDSMVVGEREIIGQLKAASQAADRAGTLSIPLRSILDQAMTVSKRVANETDVQSSGRSVVATGLDMVGVDAWPTRRVGLVGTGSYAGAVVAALRERGVSDMRVYSAGDRAGSFADTHNLPVAHGLGEILSCDVVVTCRGRGTLITTDALQGAASMPVFLDLSLTPDVDPDVARVATLVNLATIQSQPGDDLETSKAENIVHDAVHSAMARQRARQLDPVIAELRRSVMELVDDEVARLPHRPLTRDDAAHALNRLAARMLHEPSIRAHQAAEQGRASEYLAAIEEVYGPTVAPDPDRLGSGRCPVTGMTLDDIHPGTREEIA